MATLLLFANLRETAGTGCVDVPGDTVGAVLDRAVSDYGDAFAAGLGTAQVWVNGDQADRSTPVSPGDEIAVIPPVSGGAVASTPKTDLLTPTLVAGILAVLIVANLASADTLVVGAAGIAAVWLWDVRDAYLARGGAVRMIPSVLAVGAAVNGAYRWGIPGFGAGLAVGLGIVLIWSVLDRTNRDIDAFSVSLLTAVTGSVGGGSLVILGLRSPAEVGALLAVAGTGAAGAWLAARPTIATRSTDPNVAALVGAVGAGLVAGYLADTIDIITAVIAAALAGGGLIAGRTIGATIRTGRVLHTVRAPGLLTAYDGPMLAGAVFWLAMWLLT